MTGKQNRWMLLVILGLAIVATVITFSEQITFIPKLKSLKTYYGLDIKGGERVVLRAKTEEYKNRTWTKENLEAVRRILENRVNFQGVSEPVLITKEPDQVIVELPGLKDDKEALERLQSTASLQFYLLPQLGNQERNQRGIWSTETDKKTNEEYLVDNSGRRLSDVELESDVFKNDPVVTGEHLLPNCKVDSGGTKGIAVYFEFDAESAQKFEDVTRSHIGDHLAIFLDKKLISAPSINSPLPGKGIIEGSFTTESAKALADKLNAGALPVPLEILETRKLEATLGRESVAATTVAGAIGLLLVLVFMIAYYRLPGILASGALILYGLFTFALFKIIPVTLTLPGIAGFILSIGMAVDANILIFERLKEELRSGKTLRVSIDTGFKRAFTAILDSNVCTMITCVVLFWFGTGPIKGFALTLGVGVAVSMFTAITVTRTFLFSLVGFSWAQNPAAYWLDFQWKPTLNVMKRKFLWLGISGVIIIPGFIAWFAGGIKPSIDFKGGTEIQIPFAARHSANEIESVLNSLGTKYKDNRVAVSEDPDPKKQYKHLATITTERLTPDEKQNVLTTLIARVGPLDNKVDPKTGASQPMNLNDIAYSDVSGTISKELTGNAIYAVIFASLLIVLYLAFRFAIGGFMEGLKYGTCAVIALLHDILVVWGAFALLGWLFNWQIDSLFVTAMLTVIGFSVHDTIIVFDRVRENLSHRQRGENFSDLTDRSIDQTIARSVNTSFTVVLTLTALFFFGGGVIHQFIGALLIGIISGTYSSIFNASVLLVMWKQRDTGLVMAAAGSASGPRSGLSRRPTTQLPGDKPLMTPKTSSPTPTSRLNADIDTSAQDFNAGDFNESSDNERASGDDSSKTARPRRQTPRRQRRM